MELFLAGGTVGFFVGLFMAGAFSSIRDNASKIIQNAKNEAEKIISDSKSEAKKIIIEAQTKKESILLQLRVEENKKLSAIESLNCFSEISTRDQYLSIYNHILENPKNVNSNLKLIPYAASIIADFETYNFKLLADILNWGHNQARAKKVASLNTLRAEAKAKIEKYKWAEYQLGYLLNLYPALQEVIETDYKDLELDITDITEGDPTRNYLSLEEWQNLTETERNQLALDRYIESRRKSKWQIGRDYELYIGYLYERKGYKIDYFGSYMGLEDLGRDLIAKKDKTSLIIQCKYWSKEKKIHEKHIMQLYGSLIAYKLENPTENVTSVLITNIELSNTAKKFADVLGIKYLENKAIGNFPRIKCNINYTENGTTRIYHLPMDFQYDKTKIEKNGEFMAMTVSEAEANGFRRAYKWHGSYE